MEIRRVQAPQAGHFRGPGQGHHLVAHPFVKGEARAIAHGGLVGEKAQDGVAEIGGVMGVMLFVHLVDEQVHRFGLEQVDVVGVAAAVAGQVGDDHPPRAGGHVPGEHAVFQTIGNVHAVSQFVEFLHREGHDGIDFLVVKHPLIFGRKGTRGGEGIGLEGDQICHVQPSAGNGAAHVRPGAGQILLAQFLGGVDDPAVGIARGEVGIVQNPDFQPQLLGFVQNHVQILPPLVSGEIRMGPGFQAHRADVALGDFLQHIPQGGLVLSVEPQEGQNMIVFHHVTSSVFF